MEGGAPLGKTDAGVGARLFDRRYDADGHGKQVNPLTGVTMI